MPNSSGRRVVVTGAASGIGAAAASKLCASGAEVIAVDRVASDDQSLAQMVIGDLSTHAGVLAVADQIDGPIDALINNAGVAGTQPWRTVLSINALAPRDLTRALTPKFAPSPAVVTTASQAGFMWQRDFAKLNSFLAIDDWEAALDSLAGTPDLDTTCYNLSKAAAIILSGNLAVDGKHIGLRSNTVSPGTVGTPLLADFTATMGQDAIDGAATWAGRHAKPEEIADALIFLSSPESSWISGADIPVDGGFSSLIFRSYIAPAMAVAGADQ